ncbi:hypothetical protein MKX03_025639 [Papaver bracteatum]|nr:hypothetical protein MKX03_025639 [Papaver bracteatum]
MKVIEVREFGGKQEDLDDVTYFLKNSLVLQTMTIALPSYLPQNLRDRVMKKIRMLPKGSTCCVINFK